MIDPAINEWLSLVIRWLHVITGIAWIGASFYFNWLLIRLRKPERPDETVIGEVWAIHAGGFFRVQKRNIPAGQLPEPLHWFKWEAYWTWISGFSLLVLVYYFGANAYLIDRNVADISQGTAIAIGISTLVLSWFAYDLLWRWAPIKAHPRVGAAISFALAIGLAYGLSQVFSGRGAYIHVGAALGTLMVGNVFAAIMPAQRQLIAATLKGVEQSSALAENAGLRSLHNNYMTLPVVFVMFSSHYPATFGNQHAWLVLAALFLIGALVRHYFNVRVDKGTLGAAWMLVLAALMMVALAVVATPKPPPAMATVSFATAQDIVQRRCVSCHSSTPENAAFRGTVKDVLLDTPEQIQQEAARILAQAVNTQAMPLGNLTAMTAEERALLGAWIRQGARLD